MAKHVVVAIDGPAGSGKSTVAKKLAQRLGFLYADTGAMYRAVAWKALKEDMNMANPEELAELAQRIKIDLKKDGENLIVLVDGENVSKEIRTEKVTGNLKAVADAQGVRSHLVALQKEMRNHSDLVMEGRDIGTVVFPDADVKFFLSAKIKERAQRRHRELCERGEEVSLEQIIAAIEQENKSENDIQA